MDVRRSVGSLRPIRTLGFLEVVLSLKPLDVMHQEAEVGDHPHEVR